MLIEDNFSSDEIRLIDTLKNKNRMEQDEIIFDYERKMKNVNAL